MQYTQILKKFQYYTKERAIHTHGISQGIKHNLLSIIEQHYDGKQMDYVFGNNNLVNYIS